MCVYDGVELRREEISFKKKKKKKKSTFVGDIRLVTSLNSFKVNQIDNKV